MLDLAQKPSFNLSKNLLLLPRTLKLIVEMVNDSTPLIYIIKWIFFTIICNPVQRSNPTANQWKQIYLLRLEVELG